MATSDHIRDYTRFVPARPRLLAAGVMVVLLAILTPTLRRWVLYFFKDI